MPSPFGSFLAPRWRKVVRDIAQERGRTLVMVAAIAVSLIAFGAVLGAYAILTREIADNYLGTRPASATLEMAKPIDAELLDRVRRHPSVAEADARAVLVARTKVGGEWRRTLLFAIDDFADLRLNRFRVQAGARSPARGQVLIERSACALLGTGLGQVLVVRPPHGQAKELVVAGVVHDPGLAPAWQEQTGFLYLTKETLAWLGEPLGLHELRVEFRGQPRDARLVEKQSRVLAAWLAEGGDAVHELRIPPPAQHPHQRQMTTVLWMMLGFACVALVLSAIVVANALAAMLARQVREIAIMKAVGARARQIAGLYGVFIGALSLLAVAVALPVGRWGAGAFARAIATMLNFDIADGSVPHWVLAVQAATGIVVPLVLSAWPIGQASRRTVRRALDDHGVSGENIRQRWAFLPRPLRNAIRRPARLALTIGLLAAGGAMFMTASNVKRGWQANVDKVYQTRAYDVEVLLQRPASAHLAQELGRLAGVRQVEGWGFAPAAFARPGEIDVVRTYPDRGHGSLFLMAPPPSTRLVHFPVKAGRWLESGDDDVVVLNHAALAQVPGRKPGDSVLVSADVDADGQAEKLVLRLRIVGVVEEIGSPAVAYVAYESFARKLGSAQSMRLFRVQTTATSPAGRELATRDLDVTLSRLGAGVESIVPLAALRTAIGDHVKLLVNALIGMAIILALVGALGLASTMGISVVERTRELGILKTVGARPRQIVHMLLGEGVAISLSSWLVACILGVPLTHFVDSLIGNLGFLAPLPLILSVTAALGWSLMTVTVAIVATLLPARRAARLSIRDALAHT